MQISARAKVLACQKCGRDFVRPAPARICAICNPDKRIRARGKYSQYPGQSPETERETAVKQTAQLNSEIDEYQYLLSLNPATDCLGCGAMNALVRGRCSRCGLMDAE